MATLTISVRAPISSDNRKTTLSINNRAVKCVNAPFGRVHAVRPTAIRPLTQHVTRRFKSH